MKAKTNKSVLLVGSIEVIGGIWGSVFSFLFLINGVPVVAPLILLCLSIFTVIAGAMLLQSKPSGRILSFVALGIQLLSIKTPFLAFQLILPLSIMPKVYWGLPGGEFGVTLEANVIGHFLLNVMSGDAGWIVGLNVVALGLFYLVDVATAHDDNEETAV